MSERIEYRKADGSFVLRKDGKHKKTFRQKRPDPEKPGHWIWDTDGVPIIPYRLPELIEAIANERRIIIVEGEAKVDLLWSWNVPATCCVGGAGKWKAEHSAFLRGADVVILPDNDEPGRKHVDVIGSSLQDIATRIRVLVLPALGRRRTSRTGQPAAARSRSCTVSSNAKQGRGRRPKPSRHPACRSTSSSRTWSCTITSSCRRATSGRHRASTAASRRSVMGARRSQRPPGSISTSRSSR